MVVVALAAAAKAVVAQEAEGSVEAAMEQAAMEAVEETQGTGLGSAESEMVEAAMVAAAASSEVEEEPQACRPDSQADTKEAAAMAAGEMAEEAAMEDGEMATAAKERAATAVEEMAAAATAEVASEEEATEAGA